MNIDHLERPHGVFQTSTWVAVALFWLALGAAVYLAVQS
jgi:hypothetical protein